MPRLSAAIRYTLFARHKYGHGIHSPFLYRLVREVFCDKNIYPEYREIRNLRKEMLKDRRMIRRLDFGAGEETGRERTVSGIVRRVAIREKYGRLLFRLSKYLQPGNILELGTSLGFSTMYLASGNRNAEVVTLEGDPALAAIAGENFEKLSLDNIKQVTGAFDDLLPGVVTGNGPFDMVFIDGDHRSDAVLSYIRQIRKYLNPEACIILDDIHWSEDMEAGWKTAGQLPGVTLTVDLLQFGILFFKSGLARQSVVIRY